jgi:beta-glucanase (GH16 family)
MKFKSLVFLSGLLLVNLYGMTQVKVKVKVWSDEFNYNGLPDTNLWGYDVGGGGWGNNESQYYTDHRWLNARTENGKLVIEAIKENYEGSEYTSARLVTRNKGDWRYGRIEVSARLPHGRGTWPAIWMLPTDWIYGGWVKSGEIDIMEYVGFDPGVVHGSIHTEAYNHLIGTQKTDTIHVPDAETNFHVYAIEWTEEKIDFFVDDEKYFSFSNEHTGYATWPFDQRFHLLLNIAVGGSWGGQQGIDPNIWPQKMWVDYVRVFQDVPLTDIHIEGPCCVKTGQSGAVFEIQDIEGAMFQWIVPEGATIESGQGTHKIKVNWGTHQGQVKCEVIHPQAGGIYSKEVLITFEPVHSRYDLANFALQDTERWVITAIPPHQIDIFKRDSLMQINYSISPNLGNSYLEYTFPTIVSMSQLPHLNVFLKTHNQSGSVMVKIELFDAQKRFTNANPGFLISPLQFSDEIQAFHFDFSNHWNTNQASPDLQVDSNCISGLRLYLIASDSECPCSDSIWLSRIEISKENYLGISIGEIEPYIRFYPNPVRQTLYIEANKNFPDQFFIFDLTGREIYHTIINQSIEVLSLDFLRPGIYLGLLKNSRYHQYIIKQ